METEVLVIGSGIAGLTAAIQAAEAGFQVCLITKSKKLEESNSYYAQGGIVYNRQEQDPEKLAKDILRAGGKLVYRPAVDILVNEGSRFVDQILIKKASVPFEKHGRFWALTREAAHSCQRILYAADSTGKVIIDSLIAYMKTLKRIRVLTEATAVDILTRNHHTDDVLAVYHKPEALGAYVHLARTGKVEKIMARVTVLATGGIGRIYRHTTNPELATGDGIAMAYRAGGKIINMEFTQFHPTTLFTSRSANSFLISESVRGEGGVIVDQSGKEFISHVKGSLAPRDIVSIEIHNKLLSSHKDFVYLDLSRLSRTGIIDRFPTISRECRKYNIDILKDPIPVVPAFHFSCGGIRVNEWGKTNIKGLFASGEVACSGIHGANRLASTSLLEALTWSARIVRHISANKKTILEGKIPVVKDWTALGATRELDQALLNQDWGNLRNTMWNYVGIVRSRHRLQRALSDLNNLSLAIEEFYRNTPVTRNLIELRNAVTAGLIISNAAWQNRVSRGCHFRLD